MKNLGVLGSSTDPQKLSMMVSGFILGASVIIVWLAHLLGFNLVDADISNFATQAGTAVAFLMSLYGLIRKIVVAIQQKWQVYKS
jgi:hypothetical protein